MAGPGRHSRERQGGGLQAEAALAVPDQQRGQAVQHEALLRGGAARPMPGLVPAGRCPEAGCGAHGDFLCG